MNADRWGYRYTKPCPVNFGIKTMMTLDEQIAILQAAKAGKAIEGRLINSSRSDWYPSSNCFNFSLVIYRVKPEPLVLEAGKSYITDTGNKVDLLYLLNKDCRPGYFIGVLHQDGEERARHIREKDGELKGYCEDEEPKCQKIVAPWVEPKREPRKMYAIYDAFGALKHISPSHYIAETSIAATLDGISFVTFVEEGHLDA